MDHFKFEGDTKGINSRHLQFVSSVLKNRGFKDEKVNIEAVGKTGDGFVGNMKRFIVNKEDGKPFTMVAKIACDNEDSRKSMKTSLIFQNEHLMYTEVLPKLAELEKTIDLPENERFRFATCYGSLNEEPNEIILLEDLCASKFVMLDKYKSLTSETIKVVLRGLAFLHSLSYVLKHREPETFKRFGKQLLINWDIMKDMKIFITYMNQLEDDVISILDNEKYKCLIKGLLREIVSEGLKITEYYKQTSYSVIQQGDAWINNMMFRLEGEEVVECCMLDYQISSESSPASDILYAIFNGTDYETRSHHYHEWIDHYHNEMEKRLSKFGLISSDFYTRDRLDADLRRQANVMFAQVVQSASIIMRESNEAANLISKLMTEDAAVSDLSKMSTMESSGKARFKHRIEGMIRSFIELGYFKIYD